MVSKFFSFSTISKSWSLFSIFSQPQQPFKSSIPNRQQGFISTIVAGSFCGLRLGFFSSLGVKLDFGRFFNLI
jgi:hypothetical protein